MPVPQAGAGPTVVAGMRSLKYDYLAMMLGVNPKSGGAQLEKYDE
jgi:hypothetical protein